MTAIPLRRRHALMWLAAAAASAAPLVANPANQVLATSESQTRLKACGYVPKVGGAADFARFIAAESERHARIIQTAGVKPE